MSKPGVQSPLVEMLETHRPWSDARLQLWVRVYAAEYGAMRQVNIAECVYAGIDVYRRQCCAARRRDGCGVRRALPDSRRAQRAEGAEPMTREEWMSPAVPWDDNESWAERAQICVTFLCAKGLMTEGEKQKVRRRFEIQIRRSDLAMKRQLAKEAGDV